MDKSVKYDQMYMDIAERVSAMSHGKRLKVGALIVKEDNIISMGWNGMPSGMDNSCETENEDGTLSTRPEVLHAESNAIMKLVRNGGFGAAGSTLYVTDSPCPECAKLIKQAGITKVIYKREYRLTQGIDLLRNLNVDVKKLNLEEN